MRTILDTQVKKRNEKIRTKDSKNKNNDDYNDNNNDNDNRDVTSLVNKLKRKFQSK